MFLLLIICVLPLLVCSYGHGHYGNKERHYWRPHDQETYDGEFGKGIAYGQHERKDFYSADIEHPSQPPPLQRLPQQYNDIAPNAAINNMLLPMIRDNIQKAMKFYSKTKTVNLKLSGRVDVNSNIRHSIDGVDGDPTVHWRMRHHGSNILSKMDWFKRVSHFHDQLHEGKNPLTGVKPDCPFWITKQLLKLCRNPVITLKLESVLGHPLKTFGSDPMRVFNNTPGMHGLHERNVDDFLAKLETMDKGDYKLMFFGNIINTMCNQAELFINHLDTIHSVNNSLKHEETVEDADETSRYPNENSKKVITI